MIPSHIAPMPTLMDKERRQHLSGANLTLLLHGVCVIPSYQITIDLCVSSHPKQLSSQRTAERNCRLPHTEPPAPSNQGLGDYVRFLLPLGGVWSDLNHVFLLGLRSPRLVKCTHSLPINKKSHTKQKSLLALNKEKGVSSLYNHILEDSYF